jgi:glutathione peroxidase
VTVHDIAVKTLGGQDASLGDLAGNTLLVVNVASKCGLTPQYAGLQRLHDQYRDRGFAVVGFPCNQFGGQEPGSAEEIAEFCSATYGVTFPIFEKIEVNGPGRHPVYTELEKLHEQFAARGFAVVGFPCNQFGGQEPGSAEEIAEFCSATYGVTFPMFEKIEVNGPGRHPIYAALTAVPDADGEAGDIMWNFEKFVVRPDGTVAARFRPRTSPDDPAVLTAIEANLPAELLIFPLAMASSITITIARNLIFDNFYGIWLGQVPPATITTTGLGSNRFANVTNHIHTVS